LRIHLWLRIFRDIIVSSRFHYLLSSNSQWRFLRGTIPWVVRLLSLYLLLSEVATPVNPCGIRELSQESFGSWEPIMAMNISLLCSHLSPTTDRHFSFVF
jgi:hypothetical protein